MWKRRATQITAAVLANPWFSYFFERKIYQGHLKGLCFPGMNCYSCPLALFSCPIGSLQHSLAINSPVSKANSGAGARKIAGEAMRGSWRSPWGVFLYVAGFLGFIGITLGRLTCGWICPFGLLQDLVFKIPSPKFRLPAWTKYGKYVGLFLLAMLLPYLTGIHWYSRLCPVGMLEGAIPLKLVPPPISLPPSGWFFWLKMFILVAFLALMVFTRRPFCRSACALGALLSFFNPISLFRIEVDLDKCNMCGKCQRVCPFEIDVVAKPNSLECIRCLECRDACGKGAIRWTMGKPASADALVPGD
ncbi:MAG: 4Fe-4S binding protein [Actinomycetota bacterium]|nr:4Fe-4S binding protein [Actinomycetota bacterium]